MRPLLILLAALSVAACGKKHHDGLTVAAASDLTDAFEAMGTAFTKKTGKKVIFTFGSSGNLAKQIQHGGPYDVFASANRAFVDQIVNSGDAVAASRATYARGRVIVWAPGGPIGSLADLKDARFKKISLAHPDHAPYGVAGKAALQRAGVWRDVESRMVYGSNVRDALLHSETGNSDASITALSLVIRSDKEYFVIPEELHPPLEQSIAVIERSKHHEDATAFVAFVQSPEGQTILRTYGLLPAGDSSPAPR
ncbi:MAG TPA: molybdate ABC transporter substrate-binding protein [Kofleriaceae bacterium]|nr:molybdate ABC transporter substrate-binding protein [Kofleriaceae bacterium]